MLPIRLALATAGAERTTAWEGLLEDLAARIVEVNTTTNVTYGYDSDGNTTSVTDPRGTVNFEYDELHRLRNKKHGATVCCSQVKMSP